MTRYLAVSTCNEAQWKQHGRRMVSSFAKSWPKDVGMWFYAEGFLPDLPDGPPYLLAFDLEADAPWLQKFKADNLKPEHNGRIPRGYEFRFDAVKFAHKVAALGDAAEAAPCDVLIWFDADIITHALVTEAWLDSLLPETKDVAWLDRERMDPDTGFLMLRMPTAQEAVRRVVETYTSGRIFDLQQWHDGHVIKAVFQAMAKEGGLRIESLSGGAKIYHNVFANSRLAERLDHLKGIKVKEFGKTPRSQRKVKSSSVYWQ